MWRGVLRQNARRDRISREARTLRPASAGFLLRVSYRDSCHLLHSQKIREAPRQLLRSIPGLDFVEMALADQCCGSAGVYNVTETQTSLELLDRKMDSVQQTKAQIIATANPGCILQLRAGAVLRRTNQEVLHVIELLDRARISRISDEIKRKLAESGIEAWVQGRAKRPYSIWRKLKDKKINFEQLSDVFGFRAVVGSVEDCYRALGVLHRTWRMVPERFKDFISLPKSNGYRSVHTTVMGPENQRVEVQIRTQEMHEVAERGVAAHWRYREKIDESDPTAMRAFEWLRDMVDLLERGESPEEFHEHSKLSLYQDQGLLLHAEGQFDSPASRRHPDRFCLFRSHRCRQHGGGGQNQRRAYAVAYAAQERRPGRDYLLPRANSLAAVGAFRGHRPRAGRNPPLPSPRPARPACGAGPQDSRQGLHRRRLRTERQGGRGRCWKLRLSKPEDVYADIGRGALRADEVLQAVYPELKPDPTRKRNSYFQPNSTSVSIAGLTEGIGYRLGACCHPIPGDRIIGLMVPGSGLRHPFGGLRGAGSPSRQHGRLSRRSNWKDYGSAFSVARIMVRVKNTTGALASIANVIGQNGANISNLKISNRNPLYFGFQVDVEVRDATHLENLIRALKVDPTVEAVERVRGLDTDGEGAHVSAAESQGLLPFEHARH